MQYDFEWDPNKARANERKHGVTFQQAATVFHDPRALSIYDEEHSGGEDRWITLGLSATGRLFVAHHTFEEIEEGRVRIRIFSCRKATKREVSEYAE